MTLKSVSLLIYFPLSLEVMDELLKSYVWISGDLILMLFLLRDRREFLCISPRWFSWQPLGCLLCILRPMLCLWTCWMWQCSASLCNALVVHAMQKNGYVRGKTWAWVRVCLPLGRPTWGHNILLHQFIAWL